MYPPLRVNAIAASAAGALKTESEKAAEAALLCGTAEEAALVYADENAPPEYRCFFDECPPPLAFGLLLSRVHRPLSIPLSLCAKEDNPYDFLKQLLLRGETHVAP